MPKAVPLTLGYLFFNVLLSVMLIAVGNDPHVSDDVGTPGYVSSALDINQTDIDDDSSSFFKIDRWIKNYVSTILDMPWWLLGLYSFMQITFIGIIIYALVRGL